MQHIIKVRTFIDSDIREVKNIEEKASRELTPLSSILSFYKIPSEGFIIAEADGKLVGFLVANMMYTSTGELDGHILSVAVEPEYRRKGVGTSLFTHTSEMMKKNGVKKVKLEVKAGNYEAIKFYQHLGFKEYGLVKHFYRMKGYREDAILMIKHIE